MVRDPASVTEVVATFAEDYEAYFARHRQQLPAGLTMQSPLPRVALVPGLGCIAAGVDARSARINAEIAARSHLVTARVLDTFDTVEWLDEPDIFDFDYWPLELFKLQSAPPPREFSGHVAVVTGAASALGRAVVARLARDGAHLILAGDDTETLQQIAASSPEIVHGAAGDPIKAAIAAHGGVDILVALDPMSRDLHDRLRTAFQRQGLGGTLIGVETARGATLDHRRSLGDGVRSNIVHLADDADPVLVADAIAFLASSHAAATNHATVPVGNVSDA